jgi:hypothetical protein
MILNNTFAPDQLKQNDKKNYLFFSPVLTFGRVPHPHKQET